MLAHEKIEVLIISIALLVLLTIVQYNPPIITGYSTYNPNPCELTQTIDIGNPASETEIAGFGPIEPATHGGVWGNINNTRVIWFKNDNKDANITINTTNKELCQLRIKALDGMSGTTGNPKANDDFEVIINNTKVFWLTGTNQTEGENWITYTINLTGFTNIAKITLKVPDYTYQWPHFNTYGQVAIDTIEVYTRRQCTENWTCTEWSDCNNINKSRICTDKNQCNTETSKPETAQSCTNLYTFEETYDNSINLSTYTGTHAPQPGQNKITIENNQLKLPSNDWKEQVMPEMTIEPNTKLRFYANKIETGEIQAIGVARGTGTSRNELNYYLWGTQNTTNIQPIQKQWNWNYHNLNSTAYIINLGAEWSYTSKKIDRIIYIADNDENSSGLFYIDNLTISNVCNENWICSIWSNCTDFSQSRTCTDNNVCGTESYKPETIQSCCTEDWNCTDWSECNNNIQNRTCTDKNQCNTESPKPELTQNCTTQETSTPTNSASMGPPHGISEESEVVTNTEIPRKIAENNPAVKEEATPQPKKTEETKPLESKPKPFDIFTGYATVVIESAKKPYIWGPFLMLFGATLIALYTIKRKPRPIIKKPNAGQ